MLSILLAFTVYALPVPTTASADAHADTLAALSADMHEVDQVIARRLQSDVALVNQIGAYIVHAGGKRMRPKLLLMFANALGDPRGQRHELAAVVEFIHTATLLHDDVVDESALRRGKQTANAMFGNAASVLVGDFLYSRAFQMMVGCGRMRVLEVLADATNVIAEGEVLQLMNVHDPDTTVDQYLRVIRYKTAKLFEASARLGALISEQGEVMENAAAAYGRAMGTAFQLIDDALDYDGSAEVLGKNVGDDLREGKPTLPLLLAMQRCSTADRSLIREAIVNGGGDRLGDIARVVQACGALEATREAAAVEAEHAIQSIRGLPANPWTKGLLDFAARSVERLT